MLSHFSYVWLFVTPWTVSYQAPLSIVFPRQEYWSGLLCPPPGGLSDPGIKPVSVTFPALACGFFTTNAITCPVSAVKVTQSCPTLCDPMDCSLPGSSVHGILQAGILEWVAVPFSRGSFQTQESNPTLPHSCFSTIWATREDPVNVGTNVL